MKLGHSYKATANGISIVTNGNTGYDIAFLAAYLNTPILLERVVVTASQTSPVILNMQLIRRTTLSTGGSSATPGKDSPASPAAVSAFSTICTTSTGTAGDIIDANQWNEFAPYDWDIRPEGVIIAPTTTTTTPANGIGLYLPTPPASTVTASVAIWFSEIK
jgi:hypothetical protein